MTRYPISIFGGVCVLACGGLFALFVLPIVGHQYQSGAGLPEAKIVFPYRVEQFAGELRPGDHYVECRIDSFGNLYLTSVQGVLEKLAVDGSSDYLINFGSDVSDPMDIHGIAVAPDNTVYVTGVANDRTSSLIYAVPQGDNHATLYERVAGVDACGCAATSDNAVHLLSYDTVWINEVLSNKHMSPSDRTVRDVMVRRFDHRHGPSGYASVDISTSDRDELLNATKRICDRLITSDAEGRIHLVKRDTGEYDSYSGDGGYLASRKLPKASSDDKVMIRAFNYVDNEHVLYLTAYLDSEEMLKRIEVCVRNDNTDRVTRLTLAADRSHYDIDIRRDSGELIQYSFQGNRIYTYRYRLVDILSR